MTYTDELVKIQNAMELAQLWHRDQVRKYTGEPYFNHLAEVATIVAMAGCGADLVAAAYLHDIREDTACPRQDIVAACGELVAIYVDWKTDVDLSAGNRQTRCRLNRERLARAPAAVQTLHYADSISNTRSICRHDPNFAKTYLREKQEALRMITAGDPVLYRIARKLAHQEPVAA